MSTLSGKPRSPIDLSSYVSQKARERQDTGQQSDRLSEGGEPAFRSPYAPKPRPLDPAESIAAADAPASEPSIVPRAEVPFGAPSGAAGDGPDMRGVLRFERSPGEDAAPHVARLTDDLGAQAPTQPEGGEPQHDPAPAEDITSLQPELPFGESQQQPDHAARDPFSDRDFERLEASLRWLQRQEADVRMPRGPALGPVSGLAAVGDRGNGSGDDMYGRNGRLTRSLEPERMAPPPAGANGSRLPALIALLGVAAVVGGGCYFLFAGDNIRDPKPEPRLASVNPMYATPSSRPEPAVVAGQDDEQALARAKIASRFAERLQEQRSLPPAESTTRPAPIQPIPVQTTRVEPSLVPVGPPAPLVAAPPPVAQPPQSPAPAQVAVAPPVAPAVPPVAAPPADAPPRQAAAPSRAPVAPTVRTLDPEEVKTLIKKGEQFVAVGDLPAARIVFRRAAEAGDPGAAVALGATYDPMVLQRLGVVGMSAADIEKARTWYQAAESMGSQEATQRLRILANR